MSNLATEISDQLIQKIETDQAIVGVIGLGYVGLPLIDAFVSKGFSAIGYDVDPKKIKMLNAGESYIAHISQDCIKGWLKEKSSRQPKTLVGLMNQTSS